MLDCDRSQLVAVIDAIQENHDLVQVGALVTFNPPEPEFPSFTTEITKIVTVLTANEQLNKSIVRVVAQIESETEELKPGAKVYARIESPEQITLGQQAWRQILNLFKVRKYS